MYLPVKMFYYSNPQDLECECITLITHTLPHLLCDAFAEPRAFKKLFRHLY